MVTTFKPALSRLVSAFIKLLHLALIVGPLLRRTGLFHDGGAMIVLLEGIQPSAREALRPDRA